jgi:hypothetical protein
MRSTKLSATKMIIECLKPINGEYYWKAQKHRAFPVRVLDRHEKPLREDLGTGHGRIGMTIRTSVQGKMVRRNNEGRKRLLGADEGSQMVQI